jgi:hypothetical protein
VRRLGSYVLHREIADGVHVASLARGELSIVKLLASKRWLPDETYPRGAHIIALLDSGVIGDVAFTAAELVAGVDLERVFRLLRKSNAKVPEAEALLVVDGILAGLEEAGARAHGALAMSRVVLAFSGDVKLAGFGAEPRLSYAAPELTTGKKPTAASDVYAVAVLATELFCGRAFYEGAPDDDEVRSLAARGHRPELFASLDAELVSILDRALASKPADRHNGASELRRSLAAFRATRGMRSSGADREAYAGVLREAEKAHRALVVEMQAESAAIPAAAREKTMIVRMPLGPSADGPTLQLAPVTLESGPGRGLVVAGGGAFIAILASVAWLLLTREPTREPIHGPIHEPIHGLHDAGIAAERATPAPAQDAQDAGARLEAFRDAGLAVALATTEKAPLAVAVVDAGAVRESAAPDAGTRAEHREVKPRPRFAKPTTMKEKLAVLRACDTRSPCAHDLVAKASSLTEMDVSALKTFTAELDRCVSSCSR